MTCRSSVPADVRLDTQPGAQPALKCKRRSDGLSAHFNLGENRSRSVEGGRELVNEMTAGVRVRKHT